MRASGERLEIRVLGLASIADDVPPELALAAIDSVVVLGSFRASLRRAERAREGSNIARMRTARWENGPHALFMRAL